MNREWELFMFNLIFMSWMKWDSSHKNLMKIKMSHFSWVEKRTIKRAGFWLWAPRSIIYFQCWRKLRKSHVTVRFKNINFSKTLLLNDERSEGDVLVLIHHSLFLSIATLFYFHPLKWKGQRLKFIYQYLPCRNKIAAYLGVVSTLTLSE